MSNQAATIATSGKVDIIASIRVWGKKLGFQEIGFTGIDLGDHREHLKKWLDDLEEITSRNDPVIIICRSGRRSLLLANYLTKHEKFLKVYNVTEGIKGWKKANFTTRAIK